MRRARRGAVGRTRSPRRGERGAALIEAAIVTPLLVMLAIGTVEVGLLFKSGVTVANTSRAGARVGSAAGRSPDADYRVLQAVAGSSASLASVTKVVVYKSTTASGDVPAACVASSVGIAGVCNVYSAADFSVSQGTFTGGGYTKDDYWSAPTRNSSLSSGGGPDYLGVWVQGSHDALFNLVLVDRTVSDRTVMRLEPGS